MAKIGQGYPHEPVHGRLVYCIFIAWYVLHLLVVHSHCVETLATVSSSKSITRTW